MSIKKRSLIVFISIAIIISTTLTACGPNNSSTAKTDPLPEVKLTWYLLSNAQADDAMVYAEANKYIKEKINATVDFYPLNMGEYGDKIRVKLAGQEPIDIVYTCSWLNSYIDNVAKGALQPLDKLLDSYGPDLKASIPQKYWDMVKLKKLGDNSGKIYAIPNYQVMVSVNGLAFRKDLAEKYNLVDAIDKIKTYDDITPILKVIKDNEPGVFPIVDANLEPQGKYEINTSTYKYQNVGLATIVDTSTFKVLGEDDPKIVENELRIAKIRRDWYLKGYIDKNAITTNVDLEAYKKQGKVFLYQLGACKPGVEVEEKTKYSYDIITKRTTAAITSIGQVTATMNGIPTSSKNPERAMMLLNLLNTDKYLYNLLNYGIEKTHYTKLDESTIEVLKDSKFNPGMAWALGNQFNSYVQKGQPANVWELTKKLNSTAVSSPIDGFSFNTERVKTEIAQMQTVDTKYSKIILNGAADPVMTIKKRNKELNLNNNLGKVVAEAQKQLNAWKTEKAKAANKN